MAEATITLESFLKELAGKRSLTGKVRLMGRYWRQIQLLPPDQRERVALALGNKAAWSQLEKLFARDGELSEEELAIKRALDRVGTADPAELRRLAEAVRKRDTDELKSQFLRIVGGALEEEAIRQEGAELDGATDDAVPTPDETVPPPVAVTAAPAAVAHEAPPAATPQESDVVADPELVVPPGPFEAELPIEAASTADTDVRIADALEPADLSIDQDREQDGDRGAVALEPAAERQEPEGEPESPPEGPAWMQPSEERRPEDELSAVERLELLRELRRDPGAATSIGPEGRARLLERIGSGWAGRRALTQMIRDRSLDDLDEALRLARWLESPVQQAWCLADLLEHWRLDNADRRKVMEAAPTDAARRRLKRRLAHMS